MCPVDLAACVQVSQGCSLLEEALVLLQPLTPGKPPIAPQLAKEIKMGLAELQAHCALEQVRITLQCILGSG